MDRNTDVDTPMLPSRIKKKAGQRLKQYVAATSVSLGALCAGTTLAWTSPALAQLSAGPNSTASSNLSTGTDEGFRLNDREEAIVGGILAIGALVSAIPAGFLADRFGRKNVVFLTAAAFLISWILIVASVNSQMLIAGRFFAGLGTGFACVTVPIYTGEIAETSIRGVLGSFFQIFLCIGILCTCVIGSITSWKILSIVLMVMPIVFGLSFIFMPETPTYLVKINKVSEAEAVLKDLRGSSSDVSAELRAIQSELENSRQERANIGDILRSKGNRRALVSAIGVLAFQQLCGINAVVFYTVPIFKAAGSSIAPDLVGIIIALVQFAASYLSIFIIEKANRKFYLMLSSTGMLLFLATLGIYFHMKKLNVDIGILSVLPIASAVMYMASFSIGYGPIPWLLLGELFSPEIKGFGGGLAILTNWLCAFLVTFFFPISNASFGPYVTYYTLAIISGLATVFVMFVVPETRGKTLQEIQEILNK